MAYTKIIIFSITSRELEIRPVYASAAEFIQVSNGSLVLPLESRVASLYLY